MLHPSRESTSLLIQEQERNMLAKLMESVVFGKDGKAIYAMAMAVMWRYEI